MRTPFGGFGDLVGGDFGGLLDGSSWGAGGACVRGGEVRGRPATGSSDRGVRTVGVLDPGTPGHCRSGIGTFGPMNIITAVALGSAATHPPLANAQRCP